MKKSISLFMCLAMIMVNLTSVFGAEGVVKDGRTLVAVRGVFEELGFNVKWDAENNEATLSDGNHYISLIKGEEYFSADGEGIKPDVPQQIIDGKFYLPLRAIGDAIGAATSWDNENKMAHISYNGKDVYVQCNIDNYVQSQTANSKSVQTVQSNETGILINYTDYSGRKSVKMLPMSILKNFGFQSSTGNDSDFTDSNYNIRALAYNGLARITNNQTNMSTIVRCTYFEGKYCVELEGLCEYINASYSWDDNKKVAHIRYGDNDSYIKFYEKFDLSKPYMYNVPSLINVDYYAFPKSIFGNSKSAGFDYYYEDFYEYLDVYFDYISILKKNGFKVTNGGDDTRKLKYTLNKGNVKVTVEGTEEEDYCNIYIKVEG